MQSSLQRYLLVLIVLHTGLLLLMAPYPGNAQAAGQPTDDDQDDDQIPSNATLPIHDPGEEGFKEQCFYMAFTSDQGDSFAIYDSDAKLMLLDDLDNSHSMTVDRNHQLLYLRSLANLDQYVSPFPHLIIPHSCPTLSPPPPL